jgi:hypothetical protein
MTAVPGVSEECHRDSLRYLEALQNFELWALKSNYIEVMQIQRELNSILSWM